MEVYNTLTRKKEKFKPHRVDNVKIYYCGPTVYNEAHIWNLKTSVIYDFIVKTLDFVWGYKIHTAMNLTDIDDKTIRDSIAAWETLKEFTEKYTEIFMSDLDKLWIKKADNVVSISTLVSEMIEIIQNLLDKKVAYISEDGSIYFDISKHKWYWELANLDFSGMKESVRIDNDEYEKESASDFALWKAYKPEDWENSWDWVFIIDWKEITLKWRPGWHIECSACAYKYLWAQIDIHMWGEDLVFPHHQNEIAQSECFTWKQFSKYWLHSGHIMVDWKKMAKSAKNFYTIKDLENKFSEVKKDVLYRGIRYSFLNAKYREQVNFTFEKLEACFNAISKIDETSKRLNRLINTAESEVEVTIQKWGFLKVNWIRRDFREAQQQYIFDYQTVLEDDFNAPEAFAIFFDYLTFVNSNLDSELVSLEEAISMKDMIETMNYPIWLVNLELFKKEDEISEELKEMLETRQKAKEEKNYALADEMRDKIFKQGYKIIDSKTWASLEKL